MQFMSMQFQLISSNWFANSPSLDIASSAIRQVLIESAKKKNHALHGFQPGTVLCISWAMLSCRPLADLHYNYNIVTFNIACDTFLIFFSSFLEITASFIAQREVPEPLEPSPGYATVGGENLIIIAFWELRNLNPNLDFWSCILFLA